MKIAVAFENGKVFQHFGKTREFKLYEAEGQKITSSEVMSCGDTGHEALAGLLAGRGVEAVICGGLGAGAQAALDEAGIRVCSGASGDADEAVRAYLAGELVSGGVNCDHHGHHGHSHEEPESQAGGCGGSCGGNCGSSCAGCGSYEILIEGKNAGKTCRVHYRGTLDDGSVFDSSYDRGEPLSFICGVGMMISGFDKAVVHMEPGEETDIHLLPEEAYGMPDPNAVFTLKIAELPGSEDLKEGDHAYLQNAEGQPFPVLVRAKTAEEITFDANHEMAGKSLNFHIELLSAEEV